ncbi:MAG: hypothetical protein MUE69_32905 [Myxococcota bacterium]|nr:hypothetical protein [Myxococcota bacterium]
MSFEHRGPAVPPAADLTLADALRTRGLEVSYEAATRRLSMRRPDSTSTWGEDAGLDLGDEESWLAMHLRDGALVELVKEAFSSMGVCGRWEEE